MIRTVRALAAVLWGVVVAGCGETSADRAERRTGEQQAANYAGVPAACASGTPGAAGYTENLRTAGGVPLTVVTPANYDGTRGHPLLMIFAPAGISRFEVERVTGFTAPGTRAGFIVAYAEHPPLGLKTTQDLGTASGLVSAQWCVDQKQIFLAGHSDGGTVSHILAVMPKTRDQVRGIAPSGAGIRPPDLQAFGCPSPRPVMISHSKGDKSFPGWGEESARWWAACNQCSSDTRMTEDGCLDYQACAPQGRTRYCATAGGHARWPANSDRIVRFFQQNPNGE